MALEVIQEITEWKVDYRQPNHVYLMKGERAVGYQKWGRVNLSITQLNKS